MAEFDITAALKKAYQLGQTYWQQADSNYESQHKKADITEAKFKALLVEAMWTEPMPATVQGEPVAWRSLLASGSYTYCNTPQFFTNGEPLYTAPQPATSAKPEGDAKDAELTILENTQVIRDIGETLNQNGWSLSGQKLQEAALAIERAIAAIASQKGAS